MPLRQAEAEVGDVALVVLRVDELQAEPCRVALAEDVRAAEMRRDIVFGSRSRHRIDANVNVGGNNAFTFHDILGTALSGYDVHFVTSGANTMVEADTNGDGIADLQIELTGSIALTAADFIL